MIPRTIGQRIRGLQYFFLHGADEFPHVFMGVLTFGHRFFAPSFLMCLEYELTPMHRPTSIRTLFSYTLSILKQRRRAVSSLTSVQTEGTHFFYRFHGNRVIVISRNLLSDRTPVQRHDLFRIFSPSWREFVWRIC